MTTRPTVTIATVEGKPSGETHPLPAVFKSPIRPDIVQYVLLSVITSKDIHVDMERLTTSFLEPFILVWQRTSDSRML